MFTRRMELFTGAVAAGFPAFAVFASTAPTEPITGPNIMPPTAHHQTPDQGSFATTMPMRAFTSRTLSCTRISGVPGCESNMENQK